MDKILETESEWFGIAVVERSTGLTKDTLRIWERRYGFPRPARDANGERIYSAEQVGRLSLVKRLMDAGHRPGRLMQLGSEALGSLLSAVPRRDDPSATSEVLALLRAHDADRLHTFLSSTLIREGVAKFVTHTMTEANAAVGEAWLRGELQIFEEHLYSQHVQGVLRAAIQQMRPSPEGVRILLTTLPGETHGLGLLMLEAMLTLHGARCIALGTETPAFEIRKAVDAHHARVVALSFSEAFPVNPMRVALADCAELLPPPVSVWAGGAGVARLSRMPDRVTRVTDFGEAIRNLQSVSSGAGPAEGV